MKEQTFQMTSAAGCQLFGRLWIPEDSPKAVIILIHGYGEHCSRYSSFITFFEKAGFAFIGMDHIGHGQSEGKRGTIKSYAQLLDDVGSLCEKAEGYWPGIPKIIYGHSMGGNIALNYLLKRPHSLIGGIISSPWLKLVNEPGYFSKLLIKLFACLIPNVTIKSGINARHISTQHHEVINYQNDRLNHERISFRLLNAIMRQGIWAMNAISQLHTPVLLTHGSKDPITSCEASLQLANANTHFIKFQEFNNVYHEVHNDAHREQLALLYTNWFNQLID
ncbi:lysophospholipase [Carboxylicivirga mesophila]|uniref:Lysophospholipase n=1 Tax=Carboxylicivirga mesophila TaxID=1166478 RepID=A0ABS5KF13_9BACT|nr:alpha/beta hydrolase [Carboxylicivirga mesophila]MBS2213644.1 lysophospholipase [Carboxylicivirga mesophila]